MDLNLLRSPINATELIIVIASGPALQACGACARVVFKEGIGLAVDAEDDSALSNTYLRLLTDPLEEGE